MINGIVTMMLWIMGLIIMGLGGWVLQNEMKFKHKAIIVENNKGTKLTKILRAKEFQDKDGSMWWKIKKVPEVIPRPPNKHISINERGKYVCKFYQLDGGELHPLREDDSEFDETSQEFIQKVKPLTISQRQMLVSQQIKMQRQKGKNWAEVLTYAIPFIALVVIIAIVMIFADEAMQPMIELGKTNEAVTERLSVLVDKMDSVINNRVHINSIETGGGVYNTTPPN